MSRDRNSGGSHPAPSRRNVCRAAGLALAIVGGTALFSGAVNLAPTEAVPIGAVLVDEDFTGATVIPAFEGYGSACLTGAPAVGGVGAGQHELGGCPVASLGPVPPAAGSPYGFLQLTDASNDRAGAVLYTEPLPSAQGVSITFEQWQYGGTTNPPADGISFFLVDGETVLDEPGAFGGSLGYAQKLPNDDSSIPFIPGVEGGYLGIGFDVLGNYFGDWEHRSNGCATGSPAGTQLQGPPAPGENKVTVRGPGDGIEGYCLVAATSANMTTTGPWPSTLPGALHGGPLVIPPGTSPQAAASLIEPLGRTVTIDITPSPDPTVTVYIDFRDGAGVQQILQFAAPAPVPATYKFGFAASTGFFTDVHLIRTVRVQAIAVPPPPPGPQPPAADPAAELAPTGFDEDIVGASGLVLLAGGLGLIALERGRQRDAPPTSARGGIRGCRRRPQALPGDR